VLPELPSVAERWQQITDEIVGITRSIDASRWDEPSACGGWTNRQLVAHLATGYSVRIERLRRALGGETRIDVRVDIDAVNAARVRELEPCSIDEILDELMRVRGEVLVMLSQLTRPMLDATVVAEGGERRLGVALADMSHDLEHAAQLALAR
jgi:hypothetical protein